MSKSALALTLVLSMALILTAVIVAEAGDSKVIPISITIPHIIGVNTPGPGLSSPTEEKTVTAETITQIQTLYAGGRRVVLKTLVVK